MTDNVQGVFASEKINKVRWKHEDFDNSKYFVTGSWDDPVIIFLFINLIILELFFYLFFKIIYQFILYL